jgi:hypothetical protein
MPTDEPDAEAGDASGRRGQPAAARADLPELLKTRRERLGYLGEEGIDQVAGVAAVSPERWRALEHGATTPSPDELPRIALALVSISESEPEDDPALVLARLRACIGDEG